MENFESKEASQKNWDDLTADEKIERTRLMVKSMMTTGNMAHQMAMKVSNDFANHQHGMDGRVLLAIPNHGGNALMGMNSAKLSNPNHF